MWAMERLHADCLIWLGHMDAVYLVWYMGKGGYVGYVYMVWYVGKGGHTWSGMWVRAAIPGLVCG